MWSTFEELYDPGANGWGASLLTYSEIEAFIHTTGTPLRHFEARLLRRLSELYVEAQNKRALANKTGVRNLVSMDDNEGLKALFSGVGQKDVRKKPKKS